MHKWIDRQGQTKLVHFKAPPKNWESINYQEFLTGRRQRIAQVIRDGFECLKK